MSNCTYLRQALDNAALLVSQGCQNCVDSLCMGRHSDLRFLFFAALRLVSQHTVDADSLAKTLSQNALCLRVD